MDNLYTLYILAVAGAAYRRALSSRLSPLFSAAEAAQRFVIYRLVVKITLRTYRDKGSFRPISGPLRVNKRTPKVDLPLTTRCGHRHLC